MRYVKKLKIGNVVLENNILLAPMAGITDAPFRKISKRFHPGFVYTEMISAKALYYGDEKTKQLLPKTGESPIAIQLFGSDISSMQYAAQSVSNLADGIDINMGCPAPKVVKNGDGSRLLLQLDLAYEMVKAVVKSSKVPVTAKIRTGWDDEHVVAVEVANLLEEAGVKAITVHGRTRQQYYSGKANWNNIKKVKQAVTIPVIGNGDIKNEQDALKMFEQTGVDGIMIGRATIGAPWILEQIRFFLETGEKMPELTNQQKKELIVQHLLWEIQEKGEKTGILEMRKHLCAYLKKGKDASKMRQKINNLMDKQQIIDCLTEYFEQA